MPRALFLAASVAALGAGYLAVRNAADLAFQYADPERAVRFVPPSGMALSLLALNRTTENDGAVDAETRRMLRESLERAPLLANPLVLAGLDASARNDDQRARILFREAKRRDPRSIIARYWLFDDEMGRGDYIAGLADAGPLMALQPVAGNAILAYLTALLNVPQARPALIRAMRTEPSWRDDFVRQAASSPSLIAPLRQVIAAAPRRNEAAAREEQRIVIQGLANSGDFATARQLWLASLPPAFQARAHGLYNNGFADWPGGPPFNWSYPSASSGVGMPPRGGTGVSQSGLQIHFGGDAPKVVATQTVMLPPGKYSLSYQIQALSEPSSDGATIEARVYCEGPGKLLASLVAQNLSTHAKAFTLPFTAPPGCKALTVQFRAVPGMSPGPLDATIDAVDLTPAS